MQTHVPSSDTLKPVRPFYLEKSKTFPRIARQAAMLLPLLAVAIVPGYSQASDPPGFAAVSTNGNQVVAINVSCFDHQVGLLPPDPCHGELMFHDAAGHVLKRGTYDLQPGESTSLRLAIPAANANGDPIAHVLIVPCVIPAPGGRAVPSVEVFDRAAGRVILFENPAAARMSEFNNSRVDPGSLVGFNPQPDPPGFGLVTLSTSESLRLTVACFEHAVNGFPPDPCRGVAMFHDVAGNILWRGVVALDPGETKSIEFTPPASRTGAGFVSIDPCWLPAPGGRGVPNIEVLDAASGNVLLLINPAAARMSQFQMLR